MSFEAIKSSNIVESEPQLEQRLEPEPYLPMDHIQQMDTHGFEQHGQPLLATDLLSHHVEESVSHQQQQTEFDIPIAQAPEHVSDDKVAVAGATAAAATAAVVTGVAAAVGVAKTASSKAKPADVKKVDTKVKAAPIKKATATTATTSKVAAARTSAPKTDDKSKAAAPKIAPRTVASKVSTIADKKPTVTSTVPRKPAATSGEY